MQLSLGPILYYWPRQAVFDFYQAVASSPVDVIYLGEAVCSRRHELRLPDWFAIAEKLADAGKEVVFSTQALLESRTDMQTLQRITDNGRFAVEANDIGAVHRLAGKTSFVAGPHLNIYNAPTLELFAGLGAKRWIMPLEMGRKGLAKMLSDMPDPPETEVFAYGRMPLAFSARCFTARNRNLPKDDCRFSCLEHPDGLVMKTREGKHFLTLNGIQTQSAQVYNLVQEIETMKQLGVSVLRISPQANGTEKIIGIFRAALDGTLSAETANQAMRPLMPDEPCDGYWHGRPGLEQVAA